MSTARVLWYLWFRQIVNGIKRAVSSPRRLISVLVGIGYYVGFFLRPWDQRSGLGIEKEFSTKFQFDPHSVESVIFVVFMVVSIFFSLAIFSFRNTFKQSDVDVLFPLPISSKVVMFFRLFRDYAVTLFFPLLIALFTFKPAKELLNVAKKNDPQSLTHMIQGGLVAWILLSLAWISISYAVCFCVAKYEKKSALITRLVGWSILLVVILVFGSVGLRIHDAPELGTIGRATSEPWMRAIMFIPSAATAIVMGAFQGSLITSLAGVAVFAVIIVGCLAYSAKLSGYMYDQAATKGFQGQAMRDLQRKGDYAAIIAEKARSGKLGKARIAKRVAHWKFRKGWTLIYKEILIQSRVGFWLNFFFILMITAFGLMFLSIDNLSAGTKSGSYLYLAITGFMAVNMSSIQAYAGFMETLRRVEVMKPLPLTSAQIAFYETTAKAAASMFMSFIPFVFGFVYRPSLWPFHVAGMLAAPSLSMALVSAIFLIVILFPDFEDPTQRSFRGIMQLIALVVIIMPTALIFVGFLMLGISPLVPAVLSLLVNFGLTVLLTTLAGRFYADFNPSE